MDEQTKSMRNEPGVCMDQINLAALRDLVLDAIMPGEVEYFCFGHALFDPVCDLIAPNSSHLEAVYALMKFSRRKGLIPELLSEIRERNPRQYERYRSRIFTQAEVQSGPDTAVAPCTQEVHPGRWMLVFHIGTRSKGLTLALRL